MKNADQWQPSRILPRDDDFFINPQAVSPGSLYTTLEDFRVTSLFKKYLQGHLVDLGCGKVPYYQWYLNQVDQVTCIDWSQSQHGDDFIDLVADLNQHLPLASNSVDCVFSTSVLEHIREPSNLLSEISRVLKDNGYLILSVPFLYNLHEEPIDYYRYTPYCLEYLAQNVGLKLVDLQHYGSGFGVIVDTMAKITTAIVESLCRVLPPYLGKVLRKIIYFILRIFQTISYWLLKQNWMLKLTAKSNLAERMALGYVAVFTVAEADNSPAKLE